MVVVKWEAMEEDGRMFSLNTRWSHFYPLMSPNDPIDRMHTAAFTAMIGGSAVPVSLIMDALPAYCTFLNFNYLGRDVLWQIKGISGNGIQKFMKMSIRHYNDGRFGSIQSQHIQATGETITVAIATIEEKKAAVVQLAKDILSTVDIIFQKYHNAVLDYATWFREHMPPALMYPNAVTRWACDLIVHSSLIAGDVAWDVVGFAGMEPLCREDE